MHKHGTTAPDHRTDDDDDDDNAMMNSRIQKIVELLLRASKRMLPRPLNFKPIYV